MGYAQRHRQTDKKDVRDTGGEGRVARISRVEFSFLYALHAWQGYSHSEGRIEYKVACIANIASGKSRFERLDYRDPKIARFGDVAVVWFHWHAAQTWTERRPTETSLHILMVWRRAPDAWRVIARSATKVPT